VKGVAARPPAIVLGASHPSALAVIRSLGRAGIPVIAVDHDPHAVGFRSRYVGRRHLVGSGADDALACLEALGHEGGGLVVATNDHFLALVARHRARLPSTLVSTAPPWEVLGQILLKPASYARARDLGLRTPRTYTFDDPASLEKTLASLDVERHEYLLSLVDLSLPGPADVRTGRSMKTTGPDRAVIRRDCLDVLARTGRLPMLMEVIPGADEAATGVVMVVDQQHEPVLAYCLRRLPFQLTRDAGRFIHPYDLGWNVRCEAIHDEEAVRAATALVRHVGYVGVVVVEFRRDARDGGLVFVKLDPRVDRATSISTALGLDVPRALYTVFIEDRRPEPRPYSAGIRWVWLSWYLTTVWNNRARISVVHELAGLLRPRVRAWAFLSARDPLPFAIDMGRWLRKWTQRGGAWLGRGAARLMRRERGPGGDGPRGEASARRP
jgi:predicted ATP-grasp superfamily ATP-dependent carboligase